MRTLNIATAALLGLTSLSALAQVPSGTDPATDARPGQEIGVGQSMPMSNHASNIVPHDTRSNIAPTLPASSAGEGAQTREYLRAARASLVAGRTGQAQQSLEMAETRTLDRASTAAREGILRDNRYWEGARSGAEFFIHRPDPGIVLERHAEWHGRGTDHDHDDASDDAPGDHGTLHIAAFITGSGSGCDLWHGGNRDCEGGSWVE